MGFSKIGANRLEAFSDGVLAIIITIMVLELKVPHEDRFEALLQLYPVFLSYILSFIYVGIYWNNHHHMIHTCKFVSGSILWANLHLLFWLSLGPFATAWAGENLFSVLPTQVYGVVLFMAGLAYWILQRTIIAFQGPQSILKQAIGRDWKGILSPMIYLVAILVSVWSPQISRFLYIVVATMWVIPDPRISKFYHVDG
jgi:uncharacterized membrane protein